MAVASNYSWLPVKIFLGPKHPLRQCHNVTQLHWKFESSNVLDLVVMSCRKLNRFSWIRCFTIIISAWWNLTSSKLKKSKAKLNRKTRKQRQLLNESGFVLCIAHPSLSRHMRIKMKKSESGLLIAIPVTIF